MRESLHRPVRTWLTSGCTEIRCMRIRAKVRNAMITLTSDVCCRPNAIGLRTRYRHGGVDQGRTAFLRFMRVGAPGAERPVVLDDEDNAFSLSGLTSDIDGTFLAGGGIAGVRDALARGTL